MEPDAPPEPPRRSLERPGAGGAGPFLSAAAPPGSPGRAEQGPIGDTAAPALRSPGAPEPGGRKGDAEPGSALRGRPKALIRPAVPVPRVHVQNRNRLARRGPDTPTTTPRRRGLSGHRYAIPGSTESDLRPAGCLGQGRCSRHPGSATLPRPGNAGMVRRGNVMEASTAELIAAIRAKAEARLFPAPDLTTASAKEINARRSQSHRVRIVSLP